jgi:membrane-associated phospholipid phosphatase
MNPIDRRPLLLSQTSTSPRPPRPAIAVAVGSLSLIAIALSGWLAVQAGAEHAQADLVRWFNHPPQPFAVVLAASNPFLRPVPLLALAVALTGWVVWTAPVASQRWEDLRVIVLAVGVAELIAQVMKYLADQPRPLAVIPGLSNHGYPTNPRGNAYPSAHTAVIIAAVSALWPWMRWPQRIAGLAFAVLIACNRIYIGAHWPIDVLGGAAIGLFAATITWLIATRWPSTLRFNTEPGDGHQTTR